MTRFCSFIRVGDKKSENRGRASQLLPDEMIHVHGFGGEDAGDKELEPGLQADVMLLWLMCPDILVGCASGVSLT
jgi:hypothetical protein